MFRPFLLLGVVVMSSISHAVIDGNYAKNGSYLMATTVAVYSTYKVNAKVTNTPECTGVIIDARHVLTVGHCVNARFRGHHLMHVDVAFYTSNGELPFTMNRVKTVTLHPKFDAKYLDTGKIPIGEEVDFVSHDIAVLTLYKPLPRQARAAEFLQDIGVLTPDLHVDSAGFGLEVNTSEPQPTTYNRKLKWLGMDIDRMDDEKGVVILRHGSSGGAMGHGDSGAPAYVNPQRVGVSASVPQVWGLLSVGAIIEYYVRIQDHANFINNAIND